MPTINKERYDMKNSYIDVCNEVMKNQIKTRPWLSHDLNEDLTANTSVIDLRCALLKGMRDCAFYTPMSAYDMDEVHAAYITAIAGKNIAVLNDLPEIEMWFSRQIDLWEPIINSNISV